MFMAGKDDIPFNNGAVINILQTIQAIMSSAAEAELGALFINAKTAALMCQMLSKLGHQQPRTLMQTNNATAHALLTNKILPKALKVIGMHFHWLRCHDSQGKFCYCWRPGTQNLATYFTKHHPPSHHKSARPRILTSVKDPKHRKLFAKSPTTEKFIPPTKTSVSTKSFVKNLLQTPRFRTMPRNTLAAKSS
jgi:hypothetical protein